jgi:hypothetical protein
MHYGELIKMALKKKKGGWEKEWVGGFRFMGDSGFCGPCVCLGVFPVL